MSKTAWIIIGIVLLILTVIAIIYYKNKKFLNKVTDETKPGNTISANGQDKSSQVNATTKTAQPAAQQ